MYLLTNILIFCYLINLIIAYCPTFLQNQTACTCTDYIDGAIIKCNGPQGPLTVEKLKKNKIEVKELTLESANIIEVNLKKKNLIIFFINKKFRLVLKHLKI